VDAIDEAPLPRAGGSGNRTTGPQPSTRTLETPERASDNAGGMNPSLKLVSGGWADRRTVARSHELNKISDF